MNCETCKVYSGRNRHCKECNRRARVRRATARRKAKALLDRKPRVNGLFDWFNTSTTYSVKHPTKTKSSTGGMTYKGHKIWRTGNGEFEVPSIEKGTYFDTVGDAKKFIGYWEKMKNPRRESIPPNVKVKIRTAQYRIDQGFSDESDYELIERYSEKFGIDLVKKAMKERRMANPTAKKWMKCKAVRQLPNGAIQVLR